MFNELYKLKLHFKELVWLKFKADYPKSAKVIWDR